MLRQEEEKHRIIKKARDQGLKAEEKRFQSEMGIAAKEKRLET